jgi:hypothetical protein
LICLVAACTPNTAGGVRDLDSNKKTTFIADENYQAVYRKILDMTRKCREQGLITAQMIVKNDLYTDIQSGHISVELHGGLGVSVYSVTDVKAIAENKTQVTNHFSTVALTNQGPVIKKWALENYKECS